MTVTKPLGIAFAAGLVLGLGSGVIRTRVVHAAAIAAEAHAATLQESLDSTVAHDAALQELVTAKSDSLAARTAQAHAAEAQASQERAAHERDRRLAQASFDSTAATAPDTCKAVVAAARTEQEHAAQEREASDSVVTSLRVQVTSLTAQVGVERQGRLSAQQTASAAVATGQAWQTSAMKWKKAAQRTVGGKLLRALEIAGPVAAGTWLATKDQRTTTEVAAVTLVVSFAVGG